MKEFTKWFISNLIVEDSLTKKGNNMMFTTLDQDNDERSGWNCAIKWRTAGWFKDGFHANPNGQYTDSEKKGWKYILWYYWKKSEISLKTIQLMIRPRVWQRDVTADREKLLLHVSKMGEFLRKFNITWTIVKYVPLRMFYH